MRAKFINEGTLSPDILLNKSFIGENFDSEEEFNDEGDVDTLVDEEPEFIHPELNDDNDNEEDEILIKDELETSLENELKIPEYARKEFTFNVKGHQGTIMAIPMAKMKDGSYLMKADGKFKKFKLEDLIEVPL